MRKLDKTGLMTVFWLYFISVFVSMGFSFLSGKWLGASGLFASALSLVLPVAAYYTIKQKSLRNVFAMQRTIWPYYAAGLILSVTFFIVSDALTRMMLQFRTMDTDLYYGIRGLTRWDSPQKAFLIIFGSVVCVPFSEEAVFRGFLQQQLQYYFPAFKAILAASFCFVFYHFEPWFITQYFLFSLLMGTLFRRSGSFWPVFTAHAVLNLLIILFNNLGSGFLPYYESAGQVSPFYLLPAILLLYLTVQRILNRSGTRAFET
jgi:membrane protease YdiL (CAAX protease family)